MNNLYTLNSNKEMQIRGDKLLIHLTSLIEFLTFKYDEQERKESKRMK